MFKEEYRAFWIFGLFLFVMLIIAVGMSLFIDHNDERENFHKKIPSKNPFAKQEEGIPVY